MHGSVARAQSAVRHAVAGKLAADVDRDIALLGKNEVLLDTSAELITAGAAVDTALFDKATAVAAAEHSKAAAVAAAQAERDAAAAATAAAESAAAAAVSGRSAALMAMAAAVMEGAVTAHELSALQVVHTDMMQDMQQRLIQQKIQLEDWQAIDERAAAAADAADEAWAAQLAAQEEEESTVDA
jgi:hypothetical protein